MNRLLRNQPIHTTPALGNRLCTAVRSALRQAAVLAPLALVAMPALAQTTPDGADDARQRETTKLDKVEVVGHPGYITDSSRTATKTDTLLRDTPQSITVVGQEQIKDQAIQSMADAVRYVPGVGFAQGEGNRDTPIFRGNSSTADFYIDGIRDDVQFFRDVYNIDRIEVLKGPNAMIFGRGGSGGIINRVTKQAGWNNENSLSLALGSWNVKRITGDFGHAPSEAVAFRVTAMYEDSESYRDGFDLKRYGINPTMTVRAGENTTLKFSLEHFKDERVADRGIPSNFGGTAANPSLPVDTNPSTFFGNPDNSPVNAEVNALDIVVEHDFSDNVSLRNHTRYADYDKNYQNVFPGAVNAAGTEVSISAYNNDTQRKNLFNQTDLTIDIEGGSINHTVLVGSELGRQDTDNLRVTGFFTSIGPNVSSVNVPLSNPVTHLPLTFRPNATDANNHGIAKVAAVYVQDQIEFSPHFQAILGLRYDHFEVDFTNNRTGAQFSTDDSLLSPRAGLVYKPSEPVSIYANYSIARQPRAGEQLSSLSLTNQSLEPEKFENYEIGAKWDVRSDLALTLAFYQLDRTNVAITDPLDITRTILVDGQRTKGAELGVTGKITEAWSVIGGYAYQDGEITRTQTATAQKGATLAQTPKHSFSLWNKYELSETWGVGLGAIYRSESFTSTDNTVRLPGFTRYDAAVFYQPSDHLELQLNIENLLDKKYFPNANSNNNITPGSPLGVRLGLTYKF